MKPCLRCERTGWEIEKVPTTLYETGYFTTARVCRCCFGKKWIPVGVDSQSVAAGEEA